MKFRNFIAALPLGVLLGFQVQSLAQEVRLPPISSLRGLFFFRVIMAR